MSTSQQAEFAERLRQELRGALDLSAEQIEALYAHYELLLRWNSRLNLTRVTSLEEAVTVHYAESLFAAAQLPPGPCKVADVGSGGGFPGIPAAIVRPEWSVTLIESHQRKSVFLREATRNLPNVCVAPKRAEETEGEFDWVLSRAVALADLEGILNTWGSNVALLAGPEDLTSLPEFEWQSTALPWGRQRFLHVGVISRGTE
jgi:16S rRNA (guanine(527)-N(7))-methyltransferase RsmG